jgi:hypothetical protein
MTEFDRQTSILMLDFSAIESLMLYYRLQESIFYALSQIIRSYGTFFTNITKVCPIVRENWLKILFFYYSCPLI